MIIKGTTQYRLVVEEKGYGGLLFILGKLEFFERYFYNNKLELVNTLVPIENPKETKSYIEGKKMAISLIKQGFTKENYSDFLKNLNKNVKRKLEESDDYENIRHR